MGVFGRNFAERGKHLHFLVPERVCIHDGRGFHRDQRKKLEEMVLKHVPEHAGGLVVARPAFHAHRFGDGDLDMVDMVPVPERLKNRIAEPEHEDILDGFLAQVMIDPEYLVLMEQLVELIVERTRSLKVAPERFLDDDTFVGSPLCLGNQVCRRKSCNDDRVETGSGRKIVEAIDGGAPGADFPGEVCVRGRVLEVPRLVGKGPGEFSPRLCVVFCRCGRPDCIIQLRPESIVGDRCPGEPDDTRERGEPLLPEIVVKGGNEFSCRQITRSSKYDDHSLHAGSRGMMDERGNSPLSEGGTVAQCQKE